MSRSGGGWRDNYMRGLGISTRNNTIAYGYSVGLTATFGMTEQFAGADVGRIFLFVVGACVPFALVNAWVTGGFRRRFADEPGVVIALATSLSLFSVGSGLGVATLVAWLVAGWGAWLLAPFVLTIVYLAAVGAEMTIAAERHELGGRDEEE